MAVKNWTVTAKTINKKQKGTIQYINYLQDKKARSHKNTNIWHIHGNGDRFIQKAVTEALTNELAVQARGKGGRPPDGYVQSFNLSLPKNSIRPTPDQWKAIAKDLSKVIKNELPHKGSHAFMNVHDQANPHLNLCLTKFVNGNRVREVDQKKFLNCLKAQFTQSVYLHCDFNSNDYIPDNEKLGRRKERWKLDREHTERALKQFERLIEYVNQNNEKRIKSTENRIVKTLEKIQNKKEVLNMFQEVEDPDLLASIERMKDKINGNTEPEQPGQKAGKKNNRKLT